MKEEKMAIFFKNHYKNVKVRKWIRNLTIPKYGEK